MANNIKVLLENKKSQIELRNFILNENVKIRKTKTINGGYYIIITSDLPGGLGVKETAMMGKILKLTKDAVWPHTFEKPKYFKDISTGIFGWGYFVGPNVSEEKSQESLNNLKTLVSNFNTEKKLAPDTEVGGITLNQLEQIGQITQAVEGAIEATENTEIKNNLDQYLDDLQNAVENDDVFEFLIQNFEKAKTFQKRNSGWKYSILNSLIITIAQPLAQYAGPRDYWLGRNYQIKPEFVKNGVLILKPKKGVGGKGSDLNQKAKYIKDNPEALAAFKAEMGINDTENYSVDDPKNKYQLAKFATEKKYMPGQYTKFEWVPVYTDEMVEPIPGMEPQELGGVNFGDVATEDLTENITPLFNAALSIAQKDSITIPSSLTGDKNNINNFGKILHAIAIKNIAGKFDKQRDADATEFLKVQAESVAHIVKKHYNLPSESSRYNIASWGGDKEKIKSVGNTIIRIADGIIDKIDAFLKANPQNVNESYNKLKLAIRNIIKDSDLY